MRLSRMVHRLLRPGMDNVWSVADADAPTMAAALIRSGSVIAVPTDTIYGLAVDAQNSEAVALLYQIKGRDPAKPLAVCVSHINDVSVWGRADHLPDGLLHKLLPGPVTVVLQRRTVLNADLNPGVEKIAIRVPNHGFIRKLATIVRTPIALTSANFSSEPSCVSVDEFRPLWNRVAAVFDGGVLGASRSGSTIVDLSVVGKFCILRDGDNLAGVKNIMRKCNLEEQ